MPGEDVARPEQAFCPHCGTALAAWAKFCPKCGNGVDAPPSTGVQVTSAATPAPKAGRRYREALITLGVLLVAVAIVGAVAVSRGLLPGLGGQAVPPAGEIWFGDSYNPGTFEIHTRWSTTDVGRPLAGVAHTTGSVAAGGAKLHIDLDGTTIADQALSNLSGPGDLIGFTFAPPVAGTYSFSILGADGTVLAQGHIPAQ